MFSLEAGADRSTVAEVSVIWRPAVRLGSIWRLGANIMTRLGGCILRGPVAEGTEDKHSVCRRRGNEAVTTWPQGGEVMVTAGARAEVINIRRPGGEITNIRRPRGVVTDIGRPWGKVVTSRYSLVDEVSEVRRPVSVAR